MMMREPMNFTGYLHMWTLVLVVFMLNTCGKRFFYIFFLQRMRENIRDVRESVG